MGAGAGAGAGAGVGAESMLAPRGLAETARALAAALKNAPRHAKIPTPLVFDYVHRPQVQAVASSIRPQASTASTAVKKAMLDMRKTTGKPQERAVKISIEGRGL